MDYGSAILSLVKASPGKFLEALRDLSRSDSDAVEQKMRRLEDKHRDKFAKDGEVQDSSRREFLSILGVGGLGAIVAGKALKGGRTVGEKALAPLAGLKEGEEVVDSGELARLRQAAKSAEDLPKPLARSNNRHSSIQFTRLTWGGPFARKNRQWRICGTWRGSCEGCRI